MNISKICKTASHGCVAVAIVALLLASPTALRADDNNNKNKKKDSAPAKPAASPKPSAGSSSGKGSGTSDRSGSGTTGNTGGANTAGKSGGTHNTGDSGGAQTTRHSDRTNTNTSGTNTTGKSGGTQTTGNTGGTSSTGNSGGTHKERKAAGATTSNTGGTSTTGNTGTSSTGNTGGTSSTGSAGGTHKERKAAGATTSNTGGTSSTGNSGETQKNKKTAGATTSNTGGTSTTGNNAGANTTGKPGKHTTGNTGGTNTAGSTGGTRTTDNAGETQTTRKGGKAGETGGSTKITSAGPGITRGANGKVQVYRGHNGSEARFGRDGRVREVHARDMTIIHLPGGSRRIVVERGDHSRVVAYRGGYGYVQRPFVYRNHEFASRTYFYLGHPYARYYQRYPYRGLFLEGYRPYRYYRPAFYGWAYNPWRAPIRYSWGWAGNPWYGYYGGYFTPYSVYPSASFWLTDYFIAASLQEAYQQRVDNQASAYAGPVALTPEVKQAIASEVQSQLALENSESQTVTRGGDVDINSSGLPRILAEASPSHPHIFVVAGPLEVTDAAGQECGLTAGDVLRLSTAPSPDSTSADLEVFASKNQDCVRGTTVSVGLADLQEMQNHMRASIDQGLQELQAHQGGLPEPPPSAAAPAVDAPFAPIAPPADLNVSNELQQQAREADTAEQGVLDEAKQADDSGSVGDSSIPAKAPVEISLGQTTEEVVAALGKPPRVVNLGSKKIYVYPDLKITFVNGKVTNVE
jgi:hypothetical protein